MPNIVGIGNSQVPTNAMLGGLAYQDPDNTTLTKFEPGYISEIKARSDDSAVAVFIYNTANDSDGGAWRKRTQDTSWYNEGPSMDRGARKEFPCIAIIVATTQLVTIYDGDDPSCPMWMIFRRGQESNDYGQAAGNIIENQNITDIHMLNAQLVITQDRGSDSYGSPFVNFISERITYMDPNTGEGGIRHGNIAGRNQNQEKDHYVNPNNQNEGGVLIANSRMNCVTQCIFPDSRVDSLSGLPRPTIIVGTHSGISVVHSDLSVTSDNNPAGGSDGIIAMTNVNEKGHLIVVAKNNNPIYTYLYELYGPSGPTVLGAVNEASNSHKRSYYHYNLAVARFPSIPWGPGSERVCWVNDKQLALANSGACNLYLDGGKDQSTEENNTRTYARLQSEYPPAYLPNKNICCFFDVADKNSSDDGHLTSQGNLISNGNFGSGISGWNDRSGSGSSISWDSGNTRMAMNGAAAYARATTSITTIVGEYYHVEVRGAFNAFANNQHMSLQAGNVEYPNSGFSSLGSAIFKKGTWDDNEPLNITFRATATTTWIYLESGWNVAVDDVYAYRCDGDKGGGLGFTDNFGTSNCSRQLHKGIIPMGTLIRTKFNESSDIVTYSSFSGSNYFEQSYNQELNFLQNANNAYTVMVWVRPKVSSSWAPMISLDHWNGSKYLWWGTYNGVMSVGDVACGNTQIETTGWYHLCWTKFGGGNNTVKCYVNGVFDGENAPGGNYVAADHQTLIIGGRHANGQISPYIGGSMTDLNRGVDKIALCRISRGAMSVAAIKEIYLQEQQLFAPNSRNLLQSNLCRDVAYDKSTGLMHVLTSTGRDDFRGLRRINRETETTSTARIDANAGYVVEGVQ